MTKSGMKRHYSSATVGEADGAFVVLLDDRPIKTPAKKVLRVPTRSLAEAIAGEWAHQKEVLRPADMHLTAFATTTIDKIAGNTSPVIDSLVEYAQTDLLCYRAEAPAELARRQTEGWQPVLDWAANALSAPLTVTTGIIPISQPSSSLQALAHSVGDWHAMRLVPTVTIVHLLGSAILGLAVARRHLDANTALRLAHIDEDYQAEHWGEDGEAAAQWDAVCTEVTSAETFLRLVEA
jgi:chaperone required for assembly of F1-ATPase